MAKKTAILEERLDGLVDLFQRQDAQPKAGLPHSTDARPLPTYNLASRPNPEQSVPPNHSSSIHVRPPFTPLSRDDDYPRESENELDDCLHRYRSRFVPFFPTVPIRPDVTVAEMKEKRPFLLLVIRAICSKNGRRQKALEIEIRQTMGAKMLMEGERSLDVLLGLIVFIGWGHLYLCTRPILTTMVQLAMSMAFDLGLTKALPLEPVGLLLIYTSQGAPKPTNTLRAETRTLEERRACLGLWLASSMICNYFQRIDPMEWTQYLEECTHKLLGANDYRSDELLLCLVKIQRIRNQVYTVSRSDNAAVKMVREMYITSLISQLDDLKPTLSEELRSDGM